MVASYKQKITRVKLCSNFLVKRVCVRLLVGLLRRVSGNGWGW